MASIEGKADALQKWLKGWDGIGDYLKLNAAVHDAGEAAVNIVYNDHVLRRYIDGSTERDYTFELLLVTDWSAGFDTINAEALNLGARWLDWVERQYPVNVPEGFGSVTAIEPLYNTPSLKSVDEDGQTAVYSFQARITYRERS